MAESPYVFDATQQNFETDVLKASMTQPVLVDFWAAWCAPCRQLGPVLEKLADEFAGGFRLAKVDTDAEMQIASIFGIRSLPTVVLVKDGQLVDGFSGALPESQVREFLARNGVAAGEARLPTPAELRAVLAKSQLLVSLGDVDLDRLAHSSRMERFSVGEVMVDTRSSSQDLLLIAEGRAVLNLVEDDGTETGVAELSVGDTVGLLGDAPGEGRHLSSLALSDCVVLVVEAAVAAEIGSRNAEVAAAFNRTVTLRRRRVERMLERRHYEQAGNDE